MMYNALLLLLSRPHMTFLKLSQPTIKLNKPNAKPLHLHTVAGDGNF
jgi:hypothetical protein